MTLYAPLAYKFPNPTTVHFYPHTSGLKEDIVEEKEDSGGVVEDSKEGDISGDTIKGIIAVYEYCIILRFSIKNMLSSMDNYFTASLCADN